MSLLRALLTDARFALRLLRRSPLFAFTVIGVLSVGIGATTAMFSVVSALFLKPLPFTNPDELVVLHTVEPQSGAGPVSVRDLLDWQAEAKTFAGIAGTANEPQTLSSDGEPPESLIGVSVSGNYFGMLQVAPLRGRLLEPGDDRVDAAPAVVISAELWHRRFASDEHIVGKTVALGAEPYTVVGVAPEGYRFGSPDADFVDVWTPLAVARKKYPFYASEDGRGTHFLNVIGRRRADVTLGQANAELVAIAAHIAAVHENHTRISARADDLREALVGPVRHAAWLLFGAVGLVFLVVCANVASLLLIRASARRAEMAGRAALGASPGRLVGQLVTETVVVFLVAAAGGVALAHLLVDALASRIVDAAVVAITVRVDRTALLFALGIALVGGLVVAVVPAIEACRVPPHAALKESAAHASLGRGARLARSGLVIAQVALAFALLAGSGVAIRAFIALATTPLGFDATDVATATVALPAGKYKDLASVTAFYRGVADDLAARPGVVSVSANGSIPMGGTSHGGTFSIESAPDWPAGASPKMERHTVLPGYFKTFGVPILRGRDFSDADTAESRLVMIVSKASAERFFPGQDPIGRRVDWGDMGAPGGGRAWREIIGVAGDIVHLDRTDAVGPESYAPLAQHFERRMTILVKSSRVRDVLREIPGIVAARDPQQAVASRLAMADRVGHILGPRRLTVTLLGAFAGAALLLATVGLFGLVAYSTAQRTRELGIRLALGSSPERLVALVMRDGLRLLGIGIALGLVAALFAGRAIAARVAGAVAFDPAVVASILVVLGVAGTLASLIPALRAGRIPPAQALRYE